MQVRRFGSFELHPDTGELFRGGVKVELQNQPARVLEVLTRRPRELVTREDLRKAVWGGDTFVDFDRSLNFCIRRIRVALGDSSRSPRYLETLPRRGYRFVAPVALTSGGRSYRTSVLRLTAAAFLLGLLGGAAVADDRSSLHRRLVDWLHATMLASGERCPWAEG